MTDSDSDIQLNNVFTFQNQNTTITAKGPNINSTTLSSMSFRNNILTSTMDMPRNFERPRYAESVYDQRSYHRRETSPMSLHSMSGRPPRNFHGSYYRGSSSRSTYNGRGGSPMSVRSVRTMDSNTSVSAADIASAFKNMKFNKFDLRLIKEAYNTYMKHLVRKRIEKRRNLRLYMKGNRKSGYDSGELGSDSSISSDDCKSTRTCRTIYRENSPSSCRSTRTDLTDFRRTMIDSNMYQDRTDNFKHNSLKNMFSVGPTRDRGMQRENISNSNFRPQNNSIITQRERFRNGYQLPSERFNQSVASLPIPEKPYRLQRNEEIRSLKGMNEGMNAGQETDSEQEDIFSEVTVTENSTNTYGTSQRKRSLDPEDSICVSSAKRRNLSSKDTENKAKGNQNKKSKDFEFAKPHFPVKRPGNLKKVVPTMAQRPPPNLITKLIQPPLNTSVLTSYPSQQKLIPKSQLPQENLISNSKNLPESVSKLGKQAEKTIAKSKKSAEQLISKSKQPVEELISESQQPEEVLVSKSSQPLDAIDQPIHQEKNLIELTEVNQLSTTDMSVRSSFIKRKLFTQKADIAEAKNISLDVALADSSESNIYSAIQKEKNRTRKLVTTQSCLSRDVLGDDSNLLDLIHKIVPANQMNITNLNNKSEQRTNKSKPSNASSKWDVSAAISMCNGNDESDTYTDEEIFRADEQNETKIQEEPSNAVQKKSTPKCAVVLETLPLQRVNDKNKENVLPTERNDKIKKKVSPIKKIDKIKKNVTPKEKNNKNNKNVSLTERIDKNKKERIDKNKKNVPPIERIDKNKKNVTLKETIEKIKKNVSPIVQNDFKKRNIATCVKSFWDTDVESDFDNEGSTSQISNQRENSKKGNEVKNNIQHKQNIENIPPVTEIIQKSKLTAQKNMVPVQKPKKTKIQQSEQTQKNTKTKITPPQPTKDNDITKTKATKTNNKKLVESTTTASEKRKPNGVVQKSSQKRIIFDNNNSTLENNEKNKTVNVNHTLRPRALRTPKVNKCCIDRSLESNDSNETNSKSLRSRIVDLSTSITSDKSTPAKESTVRRKMPKKHVSKVCSQDKSESDISFTLTKRISPTSKQSRNNKTLAKPGNLNTTQTRTRRRDVSLTSDQKPPTKTKSRKNNISNREVESLQSSMTMYLKTGPKLRQ